MGECQGLPNPLVRHSGRRIPERRSPDSIRTSAMTHPSARQTRSSNFHRSSRGAHILRGTLFTPFGQGLDPTASARFAGSPTVGIGYARFPSSQISSPNSALPQSSRSPRPIRSNFAKFLRLRSLTGPDGVAYIAFIDDGGGAGAGRTVR